MKEEPQDDESNNETANTDDDDSDDNRVHGGWTVNIDQLIEEIRSRPAIWDMNSTEYSHRFEKIKAWENVCLAIFSNYESLTPKEKRHRVKLLQKRWKGLRNCFNREKKKKETEPGDHRKEYYYFAQLSFLAPSLASRNPRKAFFDRKPREVSTDSRSSRKMPVADHRRRRGAIDKPYRPPKVSTSRSIETIEVEVPLTIPQSTEASKDNSVKKGVNEKDHDLDFLHSLLPHLRKVPDECKLDLQSEILHTLRKYVKYRPPHKAEYSQQYGYSSNSSTCPTAVENVYIASPAVTNTSQHSDVTEDMLTDGEQI